MRGLSYCGTKNGLGAKIFKKNGEELDTVVSYLETCGSVMVYSEFSTTGAEQAKAFALQAFRR